MATSNRTFQVSFAAQDRIVRYAENIFTTLLASSNFRAHLLERDLVYIREKNLTEEHARAEAYNRAGDARRIKDPVVPVVAPQVESQLAYLTEVFLSSYPIFPVVSKPQLQAAALEIETVLGESAVHFQWARHLAMAMRDGLKYNLLAVEVDWKEQRVYSLKNDVNKEVVFGVPTEEIFQGNMIKRIDLYNAILDPRVAPAEIHTKGDFAGYSELMTRIQLKQLFLELDNTLTMNATDAFQSSPTNVTTVADGSSTVYMPQVNPAATRGLSFQGFNWMAWVNLETQNKVNYSDIYEVTTLYARIIPRELGIIAPNSGTPQIYKFIIVNRKVVIFVQRKTNAHNFLPIVVSQIIEDGLGYQTKSVADNAAPYQDIATGLYMSAIQSQRRKVYDRMFYDPSRVKKADIDRADPVARIPVTSEAYGKPVSEAIYQVPYRDEGVAGILGIAREITEMADVATGQNRVQRGQFQKGNKTRYEFDTTMNNSDARPRMAAVLLETSFFQPIKHILKSNILQYQPPTTLYNRDLKQQVEINPAELRKIIWEFKIADGVLPVDKLVNLELFGQAFQFAQTVPQAAAEYDLMGMYIYMLKLQGATWVDDFKRTPQQQQEVLNALSPTQATPGTVAPAAGNPAANVR